jgi:hypothetical protein
LVGWKVPLWAAYSELQMVPLWAVRKVRQKEPQKDWKWSRALEGFVRGLWDGLMVHWRALQRVLQRVLPSGLKRVLLWAHPMVYWMDVRLVDCWVLPRGMMWIAQMVLMMVHLRAQMKAQHSGL